MNTKRIVTRGAHALLMVVSLVGLAPRCMALPSPAPAPSPAPSPGGGGWAASFPRPWTQQGLRSVGAYREGPVVVNFESLSPLLIEPSATGAWNVLTLPPNSGQVSFGDTTPGLTPNPDPEAQFFYKRAAGAITSMAWVDQEFQHARVTVRVNTTGGPGGGGSSSRQGPLLRWDKGSNWLWCAVNFAGGTVSIVRAQHFGIMKDIEGSERAIQAFGNKKAYDVTFSAVGPGLNCKVYDKGVLVAETTATDSAPLLPGVAGVLFEVALQKPYDPLEGSFDKLAAVALPAP